MKNILSLDYLFKSIGNQFSNLPERMTKICLLRRFQHLTIVEPTCNFAQLLVALENSIWPRLQG